MSKFLIVLFRNKTKRKIIKKFKKIKSAETYFSKLVEESKEVVFETKLENTFPIVHELAIVEKDSKKSHPTYLKDEFGRNIKITLENSDYEIIRISPYRVEDEIFDISKDKKITIKYFLSNYMPKTTMKVMSILNNKVIVQNDNNINLFSLKSEDEALRFLESISELFFETKRGDCIFINDTSTPQRKYLFNLLEKHGFDKKLLYRKYTTHPRSTKK